VHATAFARPDRAVAPAAGFVEELPAAGDAVRSLSLVAELDSQVVGPVVCSRASIDHHPSLGLGPLGVLPDQQGQGVGSALMHAVLAAAAAADALDAPAVVRSPRRCRPPDRWTAGPQWPRRPPRSRSARVAVFTPRPRVLLVSSPASVAACSPRVDKELRVDGVAQDRVRQAAVAEKPLGQMVVTEDRDALVHDGGPSPLVYAIAPTRPRRRHRRRCGAGAPG
jgi:GNAT superfamily N-acetyltransferase